MLVAVAFCPAPPVLVPAVAGGASVELAPLLLACESAVQALLDERPDELVVVGGGPQTREHDAAAGGSLLGFGVDVSTGGAGAVTLPLSLTIGAWLLDRADTPLRRSYVEVDSAASPADAAALGRALAGRTERAALLVMGDGTASRTPKAPASLDARSEAYDEELARALGAGDTAALAALDPETARALAVSGRAAWQVAAAAVDASREPQHPGIKASLTAHDAPYGVGYFVASWQLPGA